MSPEKLLIKTIPLTELNDKYSDVRMCADACRSCPRYGQRWGCPPFDDDPRTPLNHYSYATILAIRCTSSDNDRCTDMLRRLIEPHLLAVEASVGGYAAALPGSCPYCAGECARSEGGDCLHPRKVRPSLEAMGYDVCSLLDRIFGLHVSWGAGSLTIAGALAHSHNPVEVEKSLENRITGILFEGIFTHGHTFFTQ